jgi:hypothetical protein
MVYLGIWEKVYLFTVKINWQVKQYLCRWHGKKISAHYKENVKRGAVKCLSAIAI